MSLIHKGRSKSPEHLNAFQSGRANRVYTEEQRKKISDTLKNSYATGKRSRARPPEYRNKISKTLTGRKLPEDVKKKISEAQKGKIKGPYGPKTLSARKSQSKIPDAVVRQIKIMLIDGISSTKVAKHFGFSRSVTDKIRDGVTYEWVNIDG